MSSAKKSCLLDPIPTTLLVEHLNELLPSITRMINLSLSTGHFPYSWKLAIVQPLLKKAGLEPVPKNYRPVSNLQYTSKLVETVVAKQLHKHLSSNNLLARIDYCNNILYGIPDYHLNKLQRIQNAAARLVCQQSRYCHITPPTFYCNLHWLPVKFRIVFKILLITFKALKGLAPTYVASLISIKSPPRYNLRSSCDSLILSCPKKLSKVTLGDCSFTYAAPKLWNALPLDIRSESTVAGFKSKLKTHLFREAFS